MEVAISLFPHVPVKGRGLNSECSWKCDHYWIHALPEIPSTFRVARPIGTPPFNLALWLDSMHCEQCHTYHCNNHNHFSAMTLGPLICTVSTAEGLTDRSCSFASSAGFCRNRFSFSLDTESGSLITEAYPVIGDPCTTECENTWVPLMMRRTKLWSDCLDYWLTQTV